MKIIFLNNQKKYKINFNYCNQIIDVFINRKLKYLKKYNNLELFISFISPQKIKQIKKELFNLNITTDVISIPIDTKNIDINLPTIFGEIFICPEIAYKNSKIYKNTFNKEINLLIVHGLLHLIGYKDETNEEIKTIRSEEEKILNLLL